MGLFDELAKQVLGQVTGGQSADAGAAGEGPNWIQLGMSLLERVGGLDGLIAKFQQGGLGDLVSSWVGQGGNLPISVEQIKQALGGVLPQVAQDVGTDTDTAARSLSEALPQIVDKLSPEGTPGQGIDLQQGLQALLNGGIGKLFS